MQKLLGRLRRCVDDYHMIEEGDVIAVGLSGGKDSVVLLYLMAQLRRFYPKSFSLRAYTVDMGLGGMDFSPLQELCASLEVPFTRIPTQIGAILFDELQETSPCALCAKLRRGALAEAITADGCTKLALGHHYDDAVETFAMNLLYEGRIGCFEPVKLLDRPGIWQIRPMLYLPEKTISNFAARQGLPVVKNACPADHSTRRQEVKDLIYRLSADYPDLKRNIFGAMQRLPLPDWKVFSENDSRPE